MCVQCYCNYGQFITEAVLAECASMLSEICARARALTHQCACEYITFVNGYGLRKRMDISANVDIHKYILRSSFISAISIFLSRTTAHAW